MAASRLQLVILNFHLPSMRKLASTAGGGAGLSCSAIMLFRCIAVPMTTEGGNANVFRLCVCVSVVDGYGPHFQG